MEQVTYHQAMDSTAMSPAQYGNGSLSMGMVHSHSAGHASLTVTSHYIDQRLSPGHLPCATVNPSTPSRGSPRLPYATIPPQPVSFKSRAPLSMHQLQKTAHRAQKLSCMLFPFCVLVLAIQTGLCSQLCQSKCHQSFEVPCQSYFIPKVLPLHSISANSTCK